MIILKTRSEVKVTVTGKWYVTVIPRCIYTPNLEFLYAPDSMQFLETRSEVKFKVTVTQLWYATLRHGKMHPHTKFEIPTSKNIRDMLRTWLF